MQPQAHKKQLYFYELAMYYWKLKLKKKNLHPSSKKNHYKLY